MASLKGTTSEFSNKHKLKSSTVNPRANRLHRRSIDWAQSRGDEINRRRKIDNLSPLQESDSTLRNESYNYKGKTPVKSGREAGSTMKDKLKKWKEEKEKKKRQEALERAKSKPFIIKTRVEHKEDAVLIKKENISEKRSGSLITKKAPSTADKNVHHGQMNSAAKLLRPKQTSHIHNKENNPAKKNLDVLKPAVRSSRVTRSSATNVTKSDSSKTKTEKFSRTSKQVVNTAQMPKGSRNKTEMSQSQETRSVGLNLAKVNTMRGERLQSFAPEDYTFTAPSNLKSFVFNPLSPTSAAVFLNDNNPDETAVMFLEQNSKRCSTPKRKESSTMEDSNTETEKKIPLCNLMGEQKSIKEQTSVQDCDRNVLVQADVLVNISQKEKELADLSIKSVEEKSTRMTRSRTSRTSTVSHDNDNIQKQNDTAEKTDCEQDGSERRARSRSKRSRTSTFGPEDVSDRDHFDEDVAKVKRSRKDSRCSVSVKGTGDLEINVTVSPDNDAALKETEDVIDSEVENVTKSKSKDEIIPDIDHSQRRQTRSTRRSLAHSLIASSNETLMNTDSPKSVRKTRKSIASSTPNKPMEEEEPEKLKVSARKIRKSIAHIPTPDRSIGEDISEKGSVRKTRKSVIATPISENPSQKTSTRKSRKSVASVITEDETLKSDTQKEPSRNTRKSVTKTLNPINGIATNSGESSAEDDVFKVTSAVSEICQIPSKGSIHPESTKQLEILPDACDEKQNKTTKVTIEKFGKGLPVPNLADDKENTTSDGKTKRKSRRTMSSTEFRAPSDPVFYSAKRSTKRQRRKTEFEMRQLLKSPEEWIQVLSKSPMVEMTRKNSKQKSPAAKVPVLDLELDLDDLQLPPKELVHDSEDIQKVIVANLSGDKSLIEDMDQVEKTADDSELCEDGEHDVKYFKKLLKLETKKFDQLTEKWNQIKDNTPGLSDEVEGQIRTVTGQANLLIAQRFKQFADLIKNCEFGLGDKETTCTDLQGFWDMIYFQVEDVHEKFKGLDKMRENNFVIKAPEVTKKIVKKKPVRKPVIRKPVKSSFAAFRAQMKKKTEASQPSNEMKVVDFGFFKVSSPVKTPKPHCEAGSPAKVVVVPSSGEAQTDSASKISLDIVNDILRTPSRKSYVPVVPSPLLQDTTPQPRMTRSQMRTSLVPRTIDAIKNEAEVAKDNTLSPSQVECATKASPAKKPSRKSVRGRKSVAFNEKVVSVAAKPLAVEEDETECTEEMNDELFTMKYLQPMEHRPSMAPKDFCPLDLVVDDHVSSHTAESTDSIDEKENCSRHRRSSLKQLPSQRRRSVRRSLTSSPLPKNLNIMKDTSNPEDREPCDVFSPLASNTESESDSERFASLNIAYTPRLAKRKARPSLLYTPPSGNALISTVPSLPLTDSSNTVPTGVLISFSP